METPLPGLPDTFIAPVCHIGTSAQLVALYADLAKAQGEFEPITKNRTGNIEYRDKATGVVVGSYQMRYADLEEITAKTRPALSKHGFATMQPISPSKVGSGLSLFTQLVHREGGMLMSEIPLNFDPKNVKDLGALITYMRRYAKVAILDVSADDDLDANGHESRGSEYNQDHPVEPRAGETRVIESGRPDTSGAYYTDEKFKTNLVGWKAAMGKGKTPDDIIRTATTRLKLTDEQIAEIRANAPQEDVTQ